MRSAPSSASATLRILVVKKGSEHRDKSWWRGAAAVDLVGNSQQLAGIIERQGLEDPHLQKKSAEITPPAQNPSTTVTPIGHKSSGIDPPVPIVPEDSNSGP
jgi:hypothetical protein